MADIRLIDDAAGTRRVSALVDEVWGASTPLLGVELVRAIGHAGGYVAAAYVDDQIVGASLGFLATPPRRAGAAQSRHRGPARACGRPDSAGRSSCTSRRGRPNEGCAWVTWTFDPLVRRNAWFNLRVLGAEVQEYLVDFYGPIDDSINARDESDRLLVAWATTTSPRDTQAARAGRRPGGRRRGGDARRHRRPATHRSTQPPNAGGTGCATSSEARSPPAPASPASLVPASMSWRSA